MPQSVVLVGPAYPFRGGIADFNESLATALVQEGHGVNLVNFTVQYPQLLFPGKTQYSGSPRTSNVPSVRIINSVNPLSWRRTVAHIQGLKPDVVVFRYWTPLMAPALGSIARGIRNKLPGCRLVAITDNIIPHEPAFYDRWLTRYFTKPFHAFVAMSKEVADELQPFLRPEQCSAIMPHPLYDRYGEAVGREESQAKLGLKPGRYLLFFGLVRPYKGLDWLLQAWKAIEKKFPDTRLLICGEFYDSPKSYDPHLSDLAVRGRVIVNNKFVPDNEVAFWFGAADALVLPYKSASQSGVTQIAWQMERPFLVTRVGGLPELCDDGRAGWLCEPNAEALTEALDRFLAEAPLQEMAEHMKRNKSRFAWPAFARGLLNVARNKE